MRRSSIAWTLMGVLIILLPVLVLAHLRFYSSRSRLPESGEEKCLLQNLQNEVRVSLDSWGVPHIEAENSQDLFFAQGYVEARDRFFQMELARRGAEGRLAEVFGEVASASDRLARRIRIGALARRQAVSEFDAEEGTALTAFADGVNAALDQYGSWIAPEIWATGIPPEAWKVEDSLAIALRFSFDCSASLFTEVRRWQELTHYGPLTAPALWGWSSRQRRSWLAPMDPSLAPSSLEMLLKNLDGWGVPGPAAEGNIFAVAGSRTASGRPLLAVDPHAPVGKARGLYVIDLKAGPINAAGFALPGLPGLLNGHNETLSWGVVGSMMDVMDLYEISLDESRNAEQIDGKWIPLRTVREEIGVRWKEEDAGFKVRISRSGPVLFEQGDRALALRWSGAESAHLMRPWLKMLEAGTVADVPKIWEGETAPPLVLIAADTDGHLLRQELGLEPRRGLGAGRLPAPGTLSRWAWGASRALSKKLIQEDPKSGFLVAANEDPFLEGEAPPGVRGFVGDFSSPWRARRLRDRLNREGNWDVDSALALQRDVFSPRLLAMLKLLRPALEEFGGVETSRLLDWDGKLEAGSREAVIYEELVADLGDEIGGDEASLAGMAVSVFDADRCLKMLAGGISQDFWDDRLTSEVEGRDEIVSRALARVDREITQLSWGEVHRRRMRHPLRGFPLFGPLFSFVSSRDHLPYGGDDSTVFQTRWNPDHPFRLVQAPSGRFIADVGDWDRSVVILPLGESGRLWSPHLKDQMGNWLSGKSRGLAYSRAAVSAAKKAGLRLIPRDTLEGPLRKGE